MWSHPDLQRFQSKQQASVQLGAQSLTLTGYSQGPLAPVLGGKRNREEYHPRNSDQEDGNVSPTPSAQEAGVTADGWEALLLRSISTKESKMGKAETEIAQLKRRIEQMEASLDTAKATHHLQSDIAHTIAAQRSERDEFGPHGQPSPSALSEIVSALTVALVSRGNADTPPKRNPGEPSRAGEGDSDDSDDSSTSLNAPTLSDVFMEVDGFGVPHQSDHNRYASLSHAATLMQGLELPHNTYATLTAALNERQQDRDSKQDTPSTSNNNPVHKQWDCVYQRVVELVQEAAPRLSLVMAPACSGKASLRADRARQGAQWVAAVEQLCKLCSPRVETADGGGPTEIGFLSAEAILNCLVVVPNFSRSQDHERCVLSVLPENEGRGERRPHCGDIRCPFQHVNQPAFHIYCIRATVDALKRCFKCPCQCEFLDFVSSVERGCEVYEEALGHVRLDIDDNEDELDVAKKTAAHVAKLLVLEQCILWYYAFVLQTFLRDFIFEVVAKELRVARKEAGCASELLSQLVSVISSRFEKHQEPPTPPPPQTHGGDAHYILSQMLQIPALDPLYGGDGGVASTHDETSDFVTLFSDSTGPHRDLIVDGVLAQLAPIALRIAPTSYRPLAAELLFNTDSPHRPPCKLFAARLAAILAVADACSRNSGGVHNAAFAFQSLLKPYLGVDASVKSHLNHPAPPTSPSSSVLECGVLFCMHTLRNEPQEEESALHAAAWTGLILIAGCLTEEASRADPATLYASGLKARFSGMMAGSTSVVVKPGATEIGADSSESLREGAAGGEFTVVRRLVDHAILQCPSCTALLSMRWHLRVAQLESTIGTSTPAPAVAQAIFDAAETTIGQFVEALGGGVSHEEELSAHVASVLVKTAILVFRCLSLMGCDEDAMTVSTLTCLVAPALGASLAQKLFSMDADALTLLEGCQLRPLGLVPMLVKARIAILQLSSTALRGLATEGSTSPLHRLFTSFLVADISGPHADLCAMVARGATFVEVDEPQSRRETVRSVLVRMAVAAEHLAQTCGVEAALVHSGIPKPEAPLHASPTHSLRIALSDILIIRALHDCEEEVIRHPSRCPQLTTMMATLQMTLWSRRTSHPSPVRPATASMNDAIVQLMDGTCGMDVTAAYNCQMAVFGWFTEGNIPVEVGAGFADLWGVCLPSTASSTPHKHIPSLSAAFTAALLRRHAFPHDTAIGGSPTEALLVSLKMLRTFATKVCGFDIVEEADGRAVLKVREEELLNDLEHCVGLASAVLNIYSRSPKAQLALRLWDWSMAELVANDSSEPITSPIRDAALGPASDGFVLLLHSILDKERTALMGIPSVFLAQVGNNEPIPGNFQLATKHPTLDDLQRLSIVGGFRTPTGANNKPVKGGVGGNHNHHSNNPAVARGPCLLESYVQLLLMRVLRAVASVSMGRA